MPWPHLLSLVYFCLVENVLKQSSRTMLLRVLRISLHSRQQRIKPVPPSAVLPNLPWNYHRDRSSLPLFNQSIDRSNFFPLDSFHLRSNLAILRVPSTETYTFPPFFGGLALFAATMFAASTVRPLFRRRRDC